MTNCAQTANTTAPGSPKTRVAYFDVAKALAIIAIITGHTAIRFVGMGAAGRGASLGIAVCFSFHLPLFFIVSGYFLHTDRPFNLQRELKSLIVPYAVTAAAVVLGLGITNHLLHDLGRTLDVMLEWANAALFGAVDLVTNPLWPQTVRIGSIWFLLALFWSRLIMSCVCRKLSPTGQAMAVVVLAFIGCWSTSLVYLPFSIQAGFAALPFLFVGITLRHLGAMDVLTKHPVVLLPLLAVWAWAVLGFEGWGLGRASYGDNVVAVIRNFLGGVASSLFVLAALKLVEEKAQPKTAIWQGLTKLGTITLPVLCVHLFEDDVFRWWGVINSYCTLGIDFSWVLMALARTAADVALAAAITATARCLHTKASRA